MILLLHPIFLFSFGTFIGLTPYIFGSDYFQSYGAFQFTDEILYVYILGFFTFSGAVFFARMTTKKKFKSKNILKKDLSRFIYIVIFISILIFVKIIQTYGTLPMLAILLGSESIEFINNIQKQTGGGLFGVFFLLIYSLIILFPYSVINKNRDNVHKWLFRIHFFLLIIYTTYSGKRQFLFVFFIYTMTYLFLYYRNIQNKLMLKKIKKTAILGILVLLTIFTAIGSLREGTAADEDKSLFDPIIHYASLPYINLSNIIIHSHENGNVYTIEAFVETSFSNLPTFIKGTLLDSMHTLEMPLLEPTSPSTVYGEIFWNFNYIGVAIYMLFFGYIVGFIYYKAIANNMIFVTMYALWAWPLLSIHTYNHFKNFMFLLIPLMLVIIGKEIYDAIPKQRRKLVTNNQK
jgi:oligosaccharide repeat unit polymerase